jgi:hypothetical protein
MFRIPPIQGLIAAFMTNFRKKYVIFNILYKKNCRFLCLNRLGTKEEY